MRSEAAPRASAAQELAPPWEQRILQRDGRRYSLRLEPAFWSALEAIAARRKLRLNWLVAEVASRRPADDNLSSILRVFCLGEIERGAGSRSSAIDSAGIAALVESAPAPGVVLDAEQVVVAANDAFLRWSGIERALVLRNKLAAHFACRGANSRDGSWTRPTRAAQARIVGIVPGRVVAADACLVPVDGTRGRRLCVVWVTGP